MALFTRDESFALARRLVAASPAFETEVTIDSTVDRFVRFASVGPTQNADRERVDVGVRVRVERGGRKLEARAECASIEFRALEATLARALRLAEASSSDALLVELGGPVAVTESGADRSTLEHGFDRKAEWIQRALDLSRAAELDPAGLAQTTATSRAIVNSRGREVFGVVGRASFSLTVSRGDASGFADRIAAKADEIDAERVVERAIDKAAKSRGARPIEPGEYEVVLEPHATSALLLFMSYEGFSARAVEEKTSFLCDRIGKRALSERLSIADDCANPWLAGFRFDGEGTPRERVVLIDRGTIGGPVTDRAHAAHSNGRSTGHALPQPSSFGPLTQNLVVLGGDRSERELVQSVRRGLLVSQLHYVNSIDPRELELTGVTRHGLFWIEDGEVRHAVKDLRFTDRLTRALVDVRGVGSEVAVAGALFDGEVAARALHLGSLRFTSGTDSRGIG